MSDWKNRQPLPWADKIKTLDARFYMNFAPTQDDLLSDDEFNEVVDTLQNWMSQMHERLEAGLPLNEDKLLPELQATFHPDGRMGRPELLHPMIHEIFYDPSMNFRYNAMLKFYKHQMMKHFQEAILTQELRPWVFLFEPIQRPYKLVFLEIYSSQMSTEVYWEMFGDTWCEIENHYQHQEVIKYLIYETEHDFNERQLMFNEDELQVWNNLPDEPLTVYRGYVHRGARRGWSWTFSPAKALFFAKRLARENQISKVVKGQVARRDIIAFFDRRNEREVVIDPRMVSRIKPFEVADYEEGEV